jgi:hypothetical protein
VQSATGLYDVTVMGQPVEQRSGHLGIAEHAGPLSGVGGDDDGSTFVDFRVRENGQLRVEISGLQQRIASLEERLFGAVS